MQPPPETNWTPPPGKPGPREVANRVKNALGILQVRGIMPEPNPAHTAIQVVALIQLLEDKGIFTKEEFKYYMNWTRMIEFEQMVLDSTPKPTIIVPGRTS